MICLRRSPSLYYRTLAYYRSEADYLLSPLDFKKSALYLPSFSFREQAGTIPGGFELHIEKTDWASAGRRQLVLRFRHSLDRTPFLKALISLGCSAQTLLSPLPCQVSVIQNDTESSQESQLRLSPNAISPAESIQLSGLQNQVSTAVTNLCCDRVFGSTQSRAPPSLAR